MGIVRNDIEPCINASPIFIRFPDRRSEPVQMRTLAKEQPICSGEGTVTRNIGGKKIRLCLDCLSDPEAKSRASRAARV